MKLRSLSGWMASLLCLAGPLTATQANASGTNRGVWCWESPAPYGLASIVGNSAAQNAAVGQFKLWGIKHVYGFYGGQLGTSQGQTSLAAWNSLLYSNGIDSQCLFSDYYWGTGNNRILLQMISFNQSQPRAAQFAGVHLDLEPWGAGSWSTTNKYNELVALAGEYQQVRAELNSNGLTNVLVYADQADWLPSLSVINWPSTAVRDTWFSDILTNLAGITLMDYEQTTLARIENAAVWQLTNYPGVIRVGIDAGAGQTWPRLNPFLTVASQVESDYTDSAGVDIYDFQSFEEIVPPVIAFGSMPALTQMGLNLIVQSPPGSNCVVQATTNLSTWQSLSNFTSQSWLNYLTDAAATNWAFRVYRVTP
jgi:hypothetical protein